MFNNGNRTRDCIDVELDLFPLEVNDVLYCCFYQSNEITLITVLGVLQYAFLKVKLLQAKELGLASPL